MIKFFNYYNKNVLIYKKIVMRKIFILLGVFILSFFSLNIVSANSVIEEKIDKVMNAFYLKIDNYDIEKKVGLLERINIKINYIKENKLDMLNEFQKSILFRVKYNNDKKITFYNYYRNILDKKEGLSTEEKSIEESIIEPNEVIEKWKNNLVKYLFTTSKKEIEVWEYMDLTVEWINEDGTTHIRDSKHGHTIYFTKLKKEYGGFEIFVFSNWMLWENMEKRVQTFIKFSTPWIKEIKWCYEWNESICWIIEVNVVEELTEEDYTLENIDIQFDWVNTISWPKNESASWYTIVLNEANGYSQGSVFVDKETLSYKLTKNLYWKDLVINVIWFSWERTKIFKWNSKDISKWEIKIDNYFEQIDISNIQDYCSGLIGGINFNLEKCTIERTIISWSTDQLLKIKLIPSNLEEYYSYNINFSGLPFYSISWLGGWAIKWILEKNLIIKSDKFSKWEYAWYISVFISGLNNDSITKEEIRLLLKLNVE